MIQNIFPSIRTPAERKSGPQPTPLPSPASALAMLGIWLPTPACQSAGGWPCYLSWILYLLSFLAILLGVILVLVVALAIRSYLKKKADLKVGP